jgi:DNA-binding NarL/FixJ family response regulator
MRGLRVGLVGSAADRAHLRTRMAEASIDIAGEFESVAAADASDVEFDAVVTRRRRVDEPVESLTAREVQVLELLAEGLPNKAIAERLSISDQTVKFHVSSISGKLGAANRTDAVRRAVRRGLVTL